VIRTAWLSDLWWSEDGGAIFYADVVTLDLWALVLDEGAAASLPSQPVSLYLPDSPDPVASNRYVYLEPEDVADEVKLHASPQALAAEGMKLVHTPSDLVKAVGEGTEWILVHRDASDEVDGRWLRQEMEAGHAVMGLWIKANDLRELMGLVPITDTPPHPLTGDWMHSHVERREGGTPSSGQGSGTLDGGILTMSQLARELESHGVSIVDIRSRPCPGGPMPTPTPTPTRRPPPSLETWTVPTPDVTLKGRIAFASDMDSQGSSEIYVMMANGSGLSRLTNNTAGDWSPSWSPDGSMLAFGSNLEDAQNGDIYAMNADGSGITRLTSDPAFDTLPDWSSDGSKIVFVSQRDEHQDDIYVMNADGTGQTNLTSNPDTDSYPAWSPDGSQIVFASRRDGNYEIYVMDADGSNQRRLTDDPDRDLNPTWSPDGQKIAFASRRDGNWEIYVMDADGSNLSRLTSHAADDTSPVWSPDGRKIAFVSDRDGGREIYVMNADGTGQARLTSNTGEDYISDWVP
jgi:Tol biopolymer transport system component